MVANELEQKRWNDARWLEIWPRRELLTRSVTPFLVAALAPRAGERLLELGSGGGVATLAVAAEVGDGDVVGLDISAALCGLAARRAAESGVRNVTFTAGDAQTDRAPGAPFDAAYSQFGVMFFDDPPAAFRNIRAQLRPGGRLAFACWRAAELNPWFLGPALAEFVPPPPEPAPGKRATGPFQLADAAATRALLEGAGFRQVVPTPHDLAVVVPETALTGREELGFMGVAPDRIDAAAEALDGVLGRFRGDDGLHVVLSFQIFTALAP